MSRLLQELLFGTFQVPENFVTRKHSICGNPDRKKPIPANSRERIIATLTGSAWKTNKQIANETELLLSRVQHQTVKLFELGKIERSTRDAPGDMKPVYMYRLSNEDVGRRD